MSRYLGKQAGLALALFYAGHLTSLALSQTSHLIVGTEFGQSNDTLPIAANITVDLDERRPVPPNLYGIFFEEIQHAGEGGLYAELVQDRSFEGLAYKAGFLESSQQEMIISTSRLGGPRAKPYTRQPKSWVELGDTVLTLTKRLSLNAHNPVAMNLSSASGYTGIANTGYWGINVMRGKGYHLSVYMRALDPGDLPSVTVTLESRDGLTVYASETFEEIQDEWHKHSAVLTADATDHNARLTVRGRGGPFLLDVLSLFPQENGREGKISPFRNDLLSLLKGLRPRFLRFPGGCYVEGVTMANGFFWKPSVGPIEERPGHWNGPWEYWSTDGLGLYEYMLLAEELGAEPIWVLNNGLSHTESIPTAQVFPLVDDALDALEFMMGPRDSFYGSIRARMGHPKPWDVKYIGIGNEDCGKPFYVGNYIAFASAIKSQYPHIRLIANCQMGADAPTELWDWHWYTDPVSMFNGRHVFDNMTVAANAHIFASEYAVFDWGIATKPAGNLQGAVAEAGFMTGIERNSEVVQLAAYAPLLANANHTGSILCPTNLIIFDNYRSFGNPSYYVQALFSEFQGEISVGTKISSRFPNDAGIAVSTTCPDSTCKRLTMKVVNFAGSIQLVGVDFVGKGAFLETYSLTTLRGNDPLASNSFDEPFKVFPIRFPVERHPKQSLFLGLLPWSVNILHLNDEHPHPSIT